jgi:hypothetical protein
MSDIKLFRIGTGPVDELTGTTDTIEKSVRSRPHMALFGSGMPTGRCPLIRAKSDLAS